MKLVEISLGTRLKLIGLSCPHEYQGIARQTTILCQKIIQISRQYVDRLLLRNKLVLCVMPP